MTSEPKSSSSPRLPPLSPEKWGDEAIEAMREAFSDSVIETFLAKGVAPNVLATMLHHPRLAGSFNRFGNRLLQEPAVGHRARELMVLRVAWRTRASYEWVHHVRLALRYGLEPDEMIAIAEGGSETWSPLERDLVAATRSTS